MALDAPVFVVNALKLQEGLGQFLYVVGVLTQSRFSKNQVTFPIRTVVSQTHEVMIPSCIPGATWNIVVNRVENCYAESVPPVPCPGTNLLANN